MDSDEKIAEKMRGLFIKDMNDKGSGVYRIMFVPYAKKTIGKDSSLESAVDGYIEMVTKMMLEKPDPVIRMPVLDALNAARTWSVSFQVPEDELTKVFRDETDLLLHVPFAGFRLAELGDEILTKYFLIPYYRELAMAPNFDNEMNRDIENFILSVH